MRETPTLLVGTRFGLGIDDPAWFEHRLPLMRAVTAASLGAQTRRDFVWAIFVNPGLDPVFRRQLDDIASSVDRCVIVEGEACNTKALLDLGGKLDLYHKGYCLTARIDDDDAWERGTVERVYRHVEAWLEARADKPGGGLAVTFPEGLEWLMYDMVDIDKLTRDGRRVIRKNSLRFYDLPFHSMSVFVLADRALNLSAMSSSHSTIEETMKRNGVDVQHDRAESRMWLYARHKQTVSSTQKSRGEPVEISMDELGARFGIDVAGTAAYIDGAGSHGYAVEKRTVFRRTQIARDIHAARTALRATDLPESDRKRCEAELAALELEQVRISSHLIAQV